MTFRPHINSSIKAEAVPLENMICLLTCGSSRCQAAPQYSLIRPPRTNPGPILLADDILMYLRPFVYF